MTGELEQAIAAIKAGNKQQGREIIAEIIKADRNNEQAWLWLTQTDITHEEKIKSLNQVLRINPNNETAKQGLAKLQGHLLKFDTPVPEETPTQPEPRHPLVNLALFCFVTVSILGMCWLFFGPSNSNQQEPASEATESFYVWVDGFENCPTHAEFGKQVVNRANTYKADGNARFIYIPHGTRIEVLDKPDEFFYKIRWNGETTYIQTLMTQPQDPSQGVVPKSEDCF